MLARFGGYGLIATGWCTYLAALFLPAIEIGELVYADGYWHEIMPGYRCFACTADPRNWLFAPVLIPYLLVNGLMIMSPFFFLARQNIMKVFGICLIAGFLLTLVAPWSYSGIRAAYYGCFAWMVSFALLGVGFVFCSSLKSVAEQNAATDGGGITVS